jgi:hypothetical protein
MLAKFVMSPVIAAQDVRFGHLGVDFDAVRFTVDFQVGVLPKVSVPRRRVRLPNVSARVRKNGKNQGQV